MPLFGKKLTPKEQVRKWNTELRKQQRVIDRQIRNIEREEKSVQRELKKAAQSGDRTVATMLARELVGSKKAKNRMHESKAQMNSVSMQLKENLAMAKMAGCLSQSTQVMAAMNNLVRVDQIQGVMMSMSQEMMRAGIIEDMIDDTLDDLDMDSDIEEEAEDEVNKILFELTEGALGQLEDVGTSELPIATSTEPVEPVSAEASMESDSADLDDMQARLAALS